MPEYLISGIPVNFPFKPYDVQTAYMEKVIACLQNSTNGILESPTGTGKTLSLLCASLAWLILKKSQIQLDIASMKNLQGNEFIDKLNQVSGKVNNAEGDNKGVNWGVPKIIYASRTHSQLSQAMQELKNTNYSFMKSVIIGSRDQLCINPEVMKENNNSAKIQMCKLKVVTRSCLFHRNVESRKDYPDFRESAVMDIEDLVKAGQKTKACPYFISKELVQNADIIFMPYNYLLDPKARRANKIDLTNTIIILDEAHNVERMCEDAASIQLKSSDVATCIDDVTHIMKVMAKDADVGADLAVDVPKDFTLEDLGVLKEILLGLETAIDDVQVPKPQEGVTFPGDFIFELLEKANLNKNNQFPVRALLDSLVQFLATVNEKNSFVRKGVGLGILCDLLMVVFAEEDVTYRHRVKQCFKVHFNVEEIRTRNQPKSDVWLSSASVSKKEAKVLNYWCFSPGFGMDQLMGKNIRSIILTSGTLAPLKPLITELGIPVAERLENPHIVGKTQICVKVVPCGPDREPLCSNFENRNNPKYIVSLARTILSFSQVIPHGMLIFFPSYPVLTKCQESWQASGMWSQIANVKPIFVEPRTKDAFTTTMTDFYAKINDPVAKGAIFMAVCRGKVSEGLDFADINGRAVLITGLPFPPLKDPRVILKKRYLSENRTKENEMMTGDEWYVLEASRAVNQAIGRVIRHKNDYGAILLCDSRFNNPRQKQQLSKWVQEHLTGPAIQVATNFGPLIGEVTRFFRNAERTLPQPCLRQLDSNETTGSPMKKFNNHTVMDDPGAGPSYGKLIPKIEKFDRKSDNVTVKYEPTSKWKFEPPGPNCYEAADVKPKQSFMAALDTHVKSIDFNDVSNLTSQISPSLVTIHKRSLTIDSESQETQRKKKYRIVPNVSSEPPVIIKKIIPEDRGELLQLIRRSIPKDLYRLFLTSVANYQKTSNGFDEFYEDLLKIFFSPNTMYIFRGMHRFLQNDHKRIFQNRIQSLNLND